MYRAPRSLWRLAPRTVAPVLFRPSIATSLQAALAPRQSLLRRPQTAAFASQSKDPPPSKQPIDYEHEKKLGQEKLKSSPGDVSTESSVRHVAEGFSASGATPGKDDPNVSAGLMHDIVRAQISELSLVAALTVATEYRTGYLSTIDCSPRVPRPRLGWHRALLRYVVIHSFLGLGSHQGASHGQRHLRRRVHKP